MGKYLAKTIKEQISQELINEIDFVASVPDTSRPTAIEISKSLGLPYNEVLIKNRYICRTFIMNNQEDALLTLGREEKHHKLFLWSITQRKK